MARIEESVEINRPVEEVFAYTTDAKSWPKWHETLLEAEQTSPGSVGVGTTFKSQEPPSTHVIRAQGVYPMPHYNYTYYTRRR